MSTILVRHRDRRHDWPCRIIMFRDMRMSRKIIKVKLARSARKWS